MDLIWTYDGRVKIGKMSNENRRITLLNYYIFSIMTAKKLGHNTIIYTDIDSVNYFKDLTNEIVVVDNYENSILWDYLKIKVLEERNGDFYLIDGDVILNRKLPKFIEDITFDTYEIGNWNTEYKNMVNLLTKMDIKNYIDIWDDIKKPVINCGILSIKNETNRLNYVYLWKKFNNWVNSNYQQNNLNVDELTMIGAQYLLTLMVENLNLSKNKLNNQMGEDGTFHRHYFGLTKFYEKLVPSNHLIDFTKSKNLI